MENKIKLLIFDLDGVLCSAKEIHYETLNSAIRNVAGGQYIITEQEHLSTYDGLKTNQKLSMLTDRKGLPPSLHKKIWDLKQEYTIKELSYIQPDIRIRDELRKAASMGFKIACCSNSIRKSVFVMLERLGVIHLMDLILSNEDVINSKPHPEIYWKAMSMFGYLPEEVLIFEDSPTGLLAAGRSGANVFRVKSPKDLEIIKTLHNFANKDIKMNLKWQDNNLNILIPMAGAGSRFEQAGYTFPKPLIEVAGKPMIQVVVENLNMDANYIFVVQKSHREKYNLDTLLKLIAPNCKIVETEGLTQGAACTALLAKEFINKDQPLFFANSDQFVEWDSNEFMYKMQETGVDGGIVTFNATHPKWSYAKINESGYVTEVAEKNPISDLATTGFYYWKKGSDFVKYAEEMIDQDLRVNGEFYIAPIFNNAIKDNKKIITYNADKMWGIGTPEDLNYYLQNYIK